MKIQQIKSGEKQILGAVIAAICIIIYLVALVQASVRLYLSVDQRKFTAEEEFNTIAVTALTTGTQGFMDDRFISTMNQTLASSKSIEALIITGPEGEYAFEKQKGKAVTWVNNSPRFINRLSFSNQGHYRALPIHDLRNVNIKAVSGAFDYYEFSKILKQTLLIILIGFAVAFFTMLMQILVGGKASEKPVRYAKTTQPSTDSAHAREYVPIIPAKDARYAKPAVVTEKAPVTEVIDDEEFDEANETFEDLETAPKGLYSPRGNIGWEEYINDRLEAELHRCASTEKDLVLILMEFTDIKDDALFRQAADETVSFFTTRDLVFEYGEQGIAVILPGADLDTGLAKSEKFYQRVAEKFPAGFSAASNLCIGLSSRSGRLLNADRLLLESGEALNKAKKDPKSSLIAFRSDPDKYRAFIASQS
jgi:GGDEF domain-containing protein